MNESEVPSSDKIRRHNTNEYNETRRTLVAEVGGDTKAHVAAHIAIPYIERKYIKIVIITPEQSEIEICKPTYSHTAIFSFQESEGIELEEVERLFSRRTFEGQQYTVSHYFMVEPLEIDFENVRGLTFSQKNIVHKVSCDFKVDGEPYSFIGEFKIKTVKDRHLDWFGP